MSALGVVLFILALLVSVMIHEWGHYATARRFGMKVTEFFVGFGPKLWSTRRGETEYGAKAIPAGGYVRIVGMTDLEEVARLANTGKVFDSIELKRPDLESVFLALTGRRLRDA